MGGGNAEAAFKSDLKLHISGSLDFHRAGSHYPGMGLYWSSDTRSGDGAGKYLYFGEDSGGVGDNRGKNQALSLRCIED